MYYGFMKADILIIEDMAEMSALIATYLRKEGMNPLCVESAEDAFKAIDSRSWDLILLDINLPGMDGFEFLDKFRKTFATPVLMVSARNADEDIISALGYGADEFITKPFSPRVLVARVRALLRRTLNAGEQATNVLSFGPFVFDPEACLLKKNGVRIALSAKEYKVFEHLVSQPGKLFSPESIYQAVWPNQYGDTSAVAVYVQRLRRKLEDDPANPQYLETVFGLGYRFTVVADNHAAVHGSEPASNQQTGAVRQEPDA